MELIFGTNKNLRKTILKHPYVVVHYCLPNCPELFENYASFAAFEEYKDIVFISIDAEKAKPVKNIVKEFQRPLVAIYKNGLMLESRSVSSQTEMKEMLDKLNESKD